ncbi:MAG: putative sugar O-methyltransferase [Ignavibacteriae bacterium]|nr:putative sugar O-methyltransferase [Ignavibacteriota bacterium]
MSIFVFLSGLSLQAELFRRQEEIKAIPVRTAPVEVNDASLVKRVVSAYQLSNRKHLGNSMWQLFFDQRHKEIHQAFNNEQLDLDQTTFLLRNPGASDLFWGIDNLAKSILSLPQITSSKAMVDCSVQCLDALVRFGEAIGAIKLNNPEAYILSPREWDGLTTVKKLEDFLGIILKFPNPYPDEIGAWTPRGVVSYRTPQALYQAVLIKNLLKGIEKPRVLEIGGGLGRTAYYARLLGIEDYTIIDIPMTAVCSAYFLGRTLGENEILLFGEKCHNPKKRIKILTPDHFFNNVHQHYDLIINVDSLTEMDPNFAKAYAFMIEKSTPIFVSINHEVNSFTVKGLFDESRYLENVQRKPYWMRNGYTEETFRFKSDELIDE